MKVYLIQRTTDGWYKRKSRFFGDEDWTEIKEKAQVFKSRGACTHALYSYSINPNSHKLGAKIVLPDGAFKFIECSI